MQVWQPEMLEAKLRELQKYSVLRYQNECEVERLQLEAEVHLRNGAHELHNKNIEISRNYAQCAEVHYVNASMLTTDIMAVFKHCQNKE